MYSSSQAAYVRAVRKYEEVGDMNAVVMLMMDRSGVLTNTIYAEDVPIHEPTDTFLQDFTGPR